ncbi:MAG: carboxypeptidase-like regulatory domain-containing protein, partial [Calditrichota bacterium]
MKILKLVWIVGFIAIATNSAWAVGGINLRLLESQENQEADLVLSEVPRNMTEPSDTVLVRWELRGRREPRVRGTLRWSNRYAGEEPQRYANAVQRYIRSNPGFIAVAGRELPVGYLFCIIDGGEEGYSAVFNVISAAGSAPEMIGPRTAARQQGINTVTPTFRWQPVQGVPYYHLLVSDQPFQIHENENGQTRVEGANLIWQGITPETSILYGIADPSGFFDNDQTPPLVGNDQNHRQRRPIYNWLVLNNYGNNPAYTSIVTGGLSGFEVEVQPPFESPQNLAPTQRQNLAGREIVLRWTDVQEAVSFFVYVSREEITPGGSQALIPAWNAQTTLTSIVCPAAEVLPEGRYVWKILAASQQGRGTLSDTTSFTYTISSGTVTFNTFDVDGNIVEFAEIQAEPIDGPALQPMGVNDAGYHRRDIPVGTYIFRAVKNGYEDDVTEEMQIERDHEYQVRFNLQLLPSGIVGTVINDDRAPISGATVSAVRLGSEDEVSTETNISGEYQLNVPPGTWLVSASANGHQPAEGVAIDVEAGHNYDLNAQHGPFVLPQYRYTISGTVQNVLGQPIQLASVTLSGPQGEAQRTFTPQSGDYSFTVGVGTWIVNAEKPGFYLESGPVEVVVTNRDIELNFTLIPQAGIFSGQVLINGNPANRNAEVWIIPNAGDVVITTVNNVGAFSQGVAPGNYILTPVRRGYSARDSLRLTVDPGETMSGLRLRLEANPSSVAGRVISANNEPLASATVSAAGVSALTDNSGNYRLAVPSGNHVVTARKQGFATSEVGPVQVEAGQNVVNINHRLVDNAGTISGRVRRGNDAIYDAVVTSTRVDNNAATTARTDREGRYSFGLRQGSYRLTVSKDGFVAAAPGYLDLQLQPGQEVSGRDFAMLNYSGRIYGEVTSQGGPINTPSINVRQLGNLNREFNANGNVQGSFTVIVTPEARYIVTASKAGFSTATDTTARIDVEGEAQLRFTLNALPCQINGVARVDQTPLSEVTVLVQGERGRYDARTDRNGVYRMDLESGQYHLTASRLGYSSAELDFRLNPGEVRQGLDAAMRENFASLSGIVNDLNDQPLEQVTITLIDTVSQRQVSAETDGDGAYLIQRIFPGAYHLRLQHPRYARGFLNLGAIVGGQQRRGVNFALSPLSSRIVGLVATPDGNPVIGATVLAASADDEISTSTSQEGRYSLSNLSEGVYDLRAEKSGYTGFPREDNNLGPGDTITVNLEMIRNNGVITGMARDPDNAGIRNVRVTAHDSLGNFASALTNPAGQFSLENLYPRTTYTVSAQLAAYQADPDTIRGVGVGESRNFLMIPNNLNISGRTVNQLGAGIGSVEIQATSLGDGSRINATSNQNGNYSLVGAGRDTRYRVITNIYDVAFTNVDTTILTGQNHINNQNLVLIERTSSIAGRTGASDILIQARNRRTLRQFSTNSGGDGSFQFTRMRDGDFVLRASRVGFRVRPDSIEVLNVGLRENRQAPQNFTVEEISLRADGRVTDDSGQPAAGIPILAWNPAGQLSDTTDNSGRFDFDGIHINQTYSFTTQMPIEGYTNSSREVQFEMADVSGIELQIVRHNASITGVVSNIRGDLVGDVRVTLDGIQEDTTNNRGLFEFNYLGRGDHNLIFRRTGYLPQEQVVRTANGEGEYNVPITLVALELAIYGTITDSSRRTLDKCVAVLTNDQNAVLRDTTGSDGSYSFNQLNPERTYSLTVSKKGYLPASRANLRVTDNSQQVDFTLSHPPNSICGSFTMPNGEKILGAQVIARSFQNRVYYDSTDHAGDYALNLTPGSYMVLAVHPQPGRGTSYNYNVSVDVGEAVELDLMLRSAGVIAGQLNVDEGGVPGSSGYIVTRHVASGQMVFNWSRPDGSFTLSGLYTGEHIITVEAAGYAMESGPVPVNVIPVDTTRVAITMTQEGKAITGYVYDDQGDGLRFARVAVEGPTPAELRTNEEGYFSLAGPEPGEYTIAVTRLGYEPPADTTFTITPGEVLTIIRRMTRIPNAISGRVVDDEGRVLENVPVYYIHQPSSERDSVVTDAEGGYIFSALEAGLYKLSARLPNYVCYPDTARINISEGGSAIDVDFKMSPDRGFALVSGRALHLNQGTLNARITLSNLANGTQRTTVSDSSGSFSFSNVRAPGTYRMRATITGRAEALSAPFNLVPEAEFTQDLVFPAGQITALLRDLSGRPILGRSVQVTGLNVVLDTLLYTDAAGIAATLDWLAAGTYNVIPAPESGCLPPAPRQVVLGLNQRETLNWYLGWRVTEPPPFSFQDSGRVEIQVPNQINVTTGDLFWQGPGQMDWNSRPLQAVSNQLSAISLRSLAPSISTLPSTLPSTLSADEAVTYFAYIPPQSRSGVLRYYLEFNTLEGFTFGGLGTARQIVITNKGMLDHIELKRTQAAVQPQIGISLKLQVQAFDDLDSSITALLPPEAYQWAEVDTSRGDLQVDANDPTMAIYTPRVLGPVRVRARVTQPAAGIELAQTLQWMNSNQVLDFIQVRAGAVEVAAGESLEFNVAPNDTAGSLMAIRPIWRTDTPIYGEITAIPYTLRAMFRSIPFRIGQVQVSARDPNTGIEGWFNIEGATNRESQGLAVYARLSGDAVDTTVYGDSQGFNVYVPPGLLYPGMVAKLYLQHRPLPQVMRLTPRYETPPLGYYVTLNAGATNQDVLPVLSLPIPENYPVKVPQVGVWDYETM